MFNRRNALIAGGGALLLPGALAANPRATYTNPVYRGSFADPFILNHTGHYYAFGTTGSERTPDGRVFTVLGSRDLVDWTPLGGAVLPPQGAQGAQFWAPEVVVHDGAFYIYYSMGGGATGASVGHQLQVARGVKPEGPYLPVAALDVAGSKFSIDPHPFRDHDGQWYLFYARDFTDSEGGFRPGTGIAVDRLVGMTKLAGEARTVMRARHDWTVFERNRTMPLYDNRVFPEWHTLEGPAVRRHKGRYYCFFSGANFLTDRYGLDYCVASSITGPYAGEGTGPRVLHSIPGHVRGPGHHCHVIAPDRQTEYLAYHAWNADMTQRELCIDPLRWTPAGPRCAGPTFTPQPTPK